MKKFSWDIFINIIIASNCGAYLNMTEDIGYNSLLSTYIVANIIGIIFGFLFGFLFRKKS